MSHKILYTGKAKTLYETDDPTLLICEFRDDISAFNAQKLANLEDKGKVNNAFNTFIMKHLEAHQIKTHFVSQQDDTRALVKRLEMIPVECVVRNIAAGSLCRRLGIKEGLNLNPPIFEYFLKNDKLGDPFINTSQILTFKWAASSELDKMREVTFQVNEILSRLFLDAGFLLVDFKLEFGRLDGEVVLGDEFTPDGCRLWEQDTQKIMDKDRFRQDLGNVVSSYKEVLERVMS